MSDSMTSYSYVNGKITTTSEAVIAVNDIGLQRSYSVFDYICTFNGNLFHFSDHYERFIRSAAELHLSPPLSCKEAEEIGIDLIEKSDLNKPALRLILTGGYSDSNSGIGNPNLIMIAEELPSYPAEAYSKGAKLITVNFQRELPRVKTTNYLNTFRLSDLKKEKGAL
ncbi:aminotransferase class IV, partial [Bacteroidota bacterium]